MDSRPDRRRLRRVLHAVSAGAHRSRVSAQLADRSLSDRGRELASEAGAAAGVWEALNALSAQPGMINMSQGFPDFEGSAVAKAAASDALRAGGPMGQYSPQPGLPALREAISRFYNRQHGVVYDPAMEVVVTAGAQEALAAIFLAYLDPGDEVLVFTPCYPFMLGAITLAGAVARAVTLQSPDFAIEEQAVREMAAASPRLKMIVLNSPHNPTGHVVDENELSILADVCRERDLIAIADDVYEYCVFPDSGRRHLRLADAEGMWDRTLTLCSGGKLFSLTGWRVAWAVGPAALMAPVGQAHSHLTFNAPTPLQAGIAAALDAEGSAEAVAEVGALYGDNHKKLKHALLAGTTARSVCAAQGGFFLVAETDGTPDVEWAARLAEEKHVVGTPMSVFYSTPFPEEAPCTLVRFTVCKSAEHIDRACAALLG